MCIYSLKEIIGSYSQLNGCVFSCFLDASKAFDRVKHSMLFTRLLRRGASGYIVRLLMFWYAHQTMRVRWGGATTQQIKVCWRRVAAPGPTISTLRDRVPVITLSSQLRL